eukprot:8416-Heterococcus_DN1.PRE.2
MPLLDSIEDWLWSDEANDATLQQYMCIALIVVVAIVATAFWQCHGSRNSSSIATLEATSAAALVVETGKCQQYCVLLAAIGANSSTNGHLLTAIPLICHFLTIQMQEKEQSVTAEIREVCKDYYAAVDAERLKLEQTLEAAAVAAAAERAAESGDGDSNGISTGDDTDHDFRKLRMPERMRLLTKNKEEGNELYAGQNWRIAGARYAKALTHAAKFFDLTPEQQAEVDVLKLALYLNLSQCFLKLENWDAVIINCTHALTVEPKSAVWPLILMVAAVALVTSTTDGTALLLVLCMPLLLHNNSSKALYRRGYAHAAKKDWDKAEIDLDDAAAITPGDAAITKMQTMVKNNIKAAAKREKSMWARAFGSKKDDAATDAAP